MSIALLTICAWLLAGFSGSVLILADEDDITVGDLPFLVMLTAAGCVTFFVGACVAVLRLVNTDRVIMRRLRK